MNTVQIQSCDGRVESLQQLNLAAFEPAIPGSKSYTNRALMIAAYTMGETRISNALFCDDTIYLAKALDSFGGLAVEIGSDYFLVKRTAEQLTAPAEPVYIGAAGTPARLLLSFASQVQGATIVTGNQRLNERPMGDLLDAFDHMGVRYECLEKPGCLPVRVFTSQPHVESWRIDGGISSQFVSSLLHLAAFSGKSKVAVEICNKLVSKPYVAMTLRMLESIGIQISHQQFQNFVVEPASPTPEHIGVEVDASAMSYFLVAAAITGTTVKINNISESSAQGDVGLVRALAEMGCSVHYQPDSVTLTGGALRGIEIDMDWMPDTVLSLAMAALFASSPTTITHIGNLRVKECDRIAAIVEGVHRLGGVTESGEDWIRIHPLQHAKPCVIECYDDHRVAMAFALLGLKGIPLQLSDYDCVSKSFPAYWDVMAAFIKHHTAH
jgi:3-phosphoshikimate 1-carboxyvinyltransferase